MDIDKRILDEINSKYSQAVGEPLPEEEEDYCGGCSCFEACRHSFIPLCDEVK